MGRWEKQLYGKQMFVLPYRDKGTQRRLNKQTPPSACQPTTPSSYFLSLSLIITLFLDQALYLDSFRQLRGRYKRKLPESPVS